VTRTGTYARILPKALLVAVSFLAAALAVPSFAQSLGELAQKEKARREREREKKGGAVKVFTEDDLPKGEKAPTTESSTASAGATSPPPATGASIRQESSDGLPNAEGEGSRAEGGPEVGGSDQSAWKARAAAARQSLKGVEQQVAAADAEVERLRQDLNPMSTTFSTDPYVSLRLQGQLTEAQARAAEAREALKSAKEAYETFENEARRAGVPPGWLRE
jgi:DNA repair exonuclease SbcCD ATPase subunit